MIFRFSSTSISGIRDYLPEGSVTGDIVMFFSTSLGLFNTKVSAMYRLKDGFAASGKVDDGQRVIISHTLPDKYWEKVCKNLMVSEISDTQTVLDGNSFTLTHTSDPDSKRMFGMVELTPINIVKTLYPETDPWEAWAANIQVTHPIYAGNSPAGVWLNEQYNMKKVATIDVYADVEANEPNGIGNIYAVRKIDDGFGVLFSPDRSDIYTYACAVYLDDPYAYQYVFGFSYTTNFKEDMSLGFTLKNGDRVTEVYKLNMETMWLDNHQMLGAWGNYITNGYAKIMGDKIFAAHYFHPAAYPGYWSIYEPNLKNTYVHTLQPDGFYDNEPGVPSFSEVPRYISTSFILYDPGTWVIAIYRTGDFEYYWSMHEVGGFGFELSGLPHRTQIMKDATTGVMFYYPTDEEVTRTNWRTDENGRLDYMSTSEMRLVVNRAFTPPEAPNPISFPSNFVGDYHLESGSISFIRKIDPDTNWFVEVGDLRNISWEDDEYDTYNFEGCVPLSGGRWFSAPEDFGGMGYVWELEVDQTNRYVSGGLIIPIIIDAVSVASITVVATVPAQTEVRLSVMDTNDPAKVKYRWNSTSWVVDPGGLVGNTLAEFHAATKSVLPVQVGQSLSLCVYLVSLDGATTPTYTSVSVDYFKGEDSKRLMSPVNAQAEYNIEALSTTQTRFTNNSGVTKYLKGSVHFIE